MRGPFLIVILLLMAEPLAAQAPPGLAPWDARTATQMLRRSPWVIERREGEEGRTIWIKAVHMVQKPNGFYALTLNGQEVDWRELFVEYAGRLVNLGLLFQYGVNVRVPSEETGEWFEPPPWPLDRP